MNKIITPVWQAALVAAVISSLLSPPTMSDIEIPNYKVIAAKKPFEIRQYPSMIIAEVSVEGERRESATAGFRILADYIFGNNQSRGGIDMTAPVQLQKSEKIDMTAPVLQQKSDDNWSISFVMPSQYNLNTLPTPSNPQITIKQVLPKTFAVIRFSGWYSDRNINKQEQALKQYMNDNQLIAISSAKYAFYNSPWTLPPLRRNEVLFEVAGKATN